MKLEPDFGPPLYVERCQHVKADGNQCGMPSYKGKDFCPAHTLIHQGEKE